MKLVLLSRRGWRIIVHVAATGISVTSVKVYSVYLSGYLGVASKMCLVRSDGTKPNLHQSGGRRRELAACSQSCSLAPGCLICTTGEIYAPSPSYTTLGINPEDTHQFGLVQVKLAKRNKAISQFLPLVPCTFENSYKGRWLKSTPDNRDASLFKSMTCYQCSLMALM